jgi:hypothetical protein
MKIALANQVDTSEFARDDEPYVEALAAIGVQVELAAWDDPEVDWSRFDLVQIRATWNYCERLPEFERWCQRVSRVSQLHNPAPLISWNADKRYLRDLETNGVPIVPTHWIEAGAQPDIAEALARFGTRRGFLKPTVGANASGTLRFNLEGDPSHAIEVHQHLAKHGREGAMMLQPYLDSVERSGELSLLYFDGALSHAVRKIPRAGDFRVQDDHGAIDAPAQPTEQQRRLGRRCIERVHELPFMSELPLYARVDLMTGPAGQDWLGELELIEPSLFFRHDPGAAGRLASALLRRA